MCDTQPNCEETEVGQVGIQSVQNDPWAHRSAGMKCATCMWYAVKASLVVAKIGRCRRHSPSMNGYPVVFPYDWCGDHKLDETKV